MGLVRESSLDCPCSMVHHLDIKPYERYGGVLSEHLAVELRHKQRRQQTSAHCFAQAAGSHQGPLGKLIRVAGSHDDTELFTDSVYYWLICYGYNAVVDRSLGSK